MCIIHLECPPFDVPLSGFRTFNLFTSKGVFLTSPNHRLSRGFLHKKRPHSKGLFLFILNIRIPRNRFWKLFYPAF